MSAIALLSRSTPKVNSSQIINYSEKISCGTLLAATAETEAVLDQAERDADALGAVTERLHGNALFDRAPYLARTVVTGGLFEPAAMDMDVDLLHRGFLRGAARLAAGRAGRLHACAFVHAP